jgi:hypothetical protein
MFERIVGTALVGGRAFGSGGRIGGRVAECRPVVDEQ